MPWQFLISGLFLGLVSSLHCAGMCGPIAMALPVQLLPKQQKALGIFLYNFGRIFTYTLLGLAAGLAGRFILVGSFQQWFSVAFGITMLIVLTLSFVFGKSMHITPLNNLYNRLQMFMAKQMRQQGLPSLFMLGMANGLLPCGMVYLAVTGALTTAAIPYGMLYMLLYGLGTLPAMFAITFFGFKINLTLRNRFKQIAPFFMAVIAVLLILRGLNLNIPYISPYFYNGNGSTAVDCMK
ncbi:MAG TPA: sulfite exporter TauE/SafE family protein [Panacibacter sp.]|nr:sulfite exporter TauE/SafE family protein [Panacibacter sp.]